MILHAEDWQLLVPHSFDRIVVQIDVTHFDVCRKRLRIDGETVILRGDGDPAALQIFYRLVRATMSELQFECRSAKREAEDLMAEANSEDRFLAHQVPNGFVSVRQRRWIARSI